MIANHREKPKLGYRNGSGSIGFFAERAEKLERVDTGIVTVAECD
jgi:hypothetical protein